VQNVQTANDVLAIAVRVYPAPPATEKTMRAGRWKRPEGVFVFDTETRTDQTQRLTFGSYRIIVAGECREEGLIYADDLSREEMRVLQAYVETHRADTVAGESPKLLLLSRSEFVDCLYRAAFKSHFLLVGFNLAFDLSRVAFDFTSARGRFVGGFALDLWCYTDKDGLERHHPYRPRVAIKHIDSKRQLKGFTGTYKPDSVDLIPEDSTTQEPDPRFKFRGHFLDLRTLAFSLTDRSYTLATACEAFGVEHGKQRVESHGQITADYIDYNRRDVLATSELLVKLLEEYDRHPISLQVTKSYSPASNGKAYLRAMNISPVFRRQPDFPKKILGFAQSAFFGGRTSAHIRKTAVPIVYTDFLSMYPTVNGLMDLWRFVIAGRIEVVENCVPQIDTFLRGVKMADLFRPATWKRMPAFVKIVPDGDILPVRAKYSEANDWQVAVNHLYTRNEENALWFSLPDVVASVILTGRVPKIVDAFRLEAKGVQNLQAVKLRGAIPVDPRKEDFFRVAIEERQRVKSRKDISDDERTRLDRALKVLANATSYGIYAEMIREESDEKVKMTCHGIDPEPYECLVTHPERPGEYCFPVMASLITSAARLVLALLERCVTELGGTYAFEDTDSMAIVATERGGLVPCPGGADRIGKREAIRALSWDQVDKLADRFEALNPYDRKAIPGSILKIEKDNRDPVTGKQRQIYCYAISAKRYALFVLDKKRHPVLLEKDVNNEDDRWSEHGLGHLMNPTDPDSDDRKWIKQVWLNIVRKADKLPVQEPAWSKLPAVGRVSVSSPAVMRAFRDLNRDKPYRDQMKPFNFVVACQVAPGGHPLNADPNRFHLIAPYETDSKKWLSKKWSDQYTGREHRITTEGHDDSPKTARVRTYGGVLREYEFHPESKCADADGNTCDRQTVGLLRRRHTRIGLIKYIGKESNSLEDVESGMEQSADNVYTEYPDPRRDEWQTELLPALRVVPLPVLIAETGMSGRALQYLRTGRRRPQARNLEALRAVLQKLRMEGAEN
jgi:hypothetical protein